MRFTSPWASTATTLLEGVKHGLTLLKLGGYFVRLQPQQHALQAAKLSAQRADQRAEQDGQQHVPTAVGDLFVHFTSEMPTTTTPIC